MRVWVTLPSGWSYDGKVQNADTGEDLGLSITGLRLDANAGEINELYLKVIDVSGEFLAEHIELKLDLWLQLLLWWYRFKSKIWH